MLSEATPHLRVFTSDLPSLSLCEYATRELLRPAVDRGNGRDLDPLSRGWFEEIELKRYTRSGAWLPRLLEFSRHPDESLLMLGPGLGTDALQYLRHHVAVTLAVLPHDPTDAIRRNFEFRGLDPLFLPISSRERVQVADRSFDLAYLNALHEPTGEIPLIIQELYRILKPGGKLFAMVPARYDVDRWQSWFHPFSRSQQLPTASSALANYSARELRQIHGEFEEVRIQKRHLRRSELPHVWRLIPLSLAERIGGRILIVRAKKPITGKRVLQAAA